MKKFQSKMKVNNFFVRESQTVTVVVMSDRPLAAKNIIFYVLLRKAMLAKEMMMPCSSTIF
jgi:hypothetical protein